MESLLHNDWQSILAPELNSPEFKTLINFLHQERESFNIFPPQAEVFNAFNFTNFKQTRVVILGQDPYHELNQAQGLSFSVARGVKIPPSLRNIYQELATDLAIEPVKHGDLSAWAQQGVLLLNSVLTVREGQANSHRQRGWEMLTDAAIQALSAKPEPVVFILWGKPAQMKQKLIDETHNLVLTSPHPSPLSAYRGFFGSKPFSKTNAYLNTHGQQPINWHLPA